jgi:hypothetical protein
VEASLSGLLILADVHPGDAVLGVCLNMIRL